MAAKRARGEGSLFRIKSGKHQGKWCAVVTEGWVNGKRKYKRFIRKTQGEAQKCLRDTIDFKEKTGTVPKGEGTTLSRHITEWLEVARPSLKPSTYCNYLSISKNHIEPKLGHLKLRDVNTRTVEKWLSKMSEDEVGPRTRQLARFILRTAMDKALDWDRVLRNPVAKTEHITYDAEKFDIWDTDETNRFFKTARKLASRFYALFVLALDTGMREGELLALRWSDIDLSSCNVRVERSLSEIGGKHLGEAPRKYIGTVKTKAANRTIKMHSSTVAVLKSHREELLGNGLYQKSGYVFPDTIGGVMGKSNFINSHFKPVVEEAKVTPVRFHYLRHMAATRMLRSGVPVHVVSARLGHKSIEVTLKYYSHVMPQDDSRAADSFGTVKVG